MEIDRGDQDVDVTGPAVELGLATQQAPGRAVEGERLEQCPKPRVDFDEIGQLDRQWRLLVPPLGREAGSPWIPRDGRRLGGAFGRPLAS
jgi:hypothetical protein